MSGGVDDLEKHADLGYEFMVRGGGGVGEDGDGEGGDDGGQGGWRRTGRGGGSECMQ